MSIEVMALVMRRAMGSATRKAVMLAMADASNEDGCGIWKSADTIAAQAEISRRTVLRVWHELESEGLICRTGTRPVRGGEVIIWDIDIQEVSDLPRAVPAVIRPGDMVSPGDTDATDPVTLTPRPGDTVSHNTSLTRPINPSPAPALELVSQEAPSGPDRLQSTLKAIWDSGPPQSRERSGRKRLSEAVAKILRARKDIAPAQLLAAWEAFLRTPDARKDHGRFCPGIHVWLNDNRFDAFLPPVAGAAEASPGDQRRLNLERCFAQYGSGGAWRGREFDSPIRPDDSAAAGLYPEDLYAQYQVPRPEPVA